jgi:RNA-directed DNA polymerase
MGPGAGKQGSPYGWSGRHTAYSIETVQGIKEFLERLRISLKVRSFCSLPFRERMIPKPNGKLRRLEIVTVTDRAMQASLKLVLEQIFEANFLSCSYGFHPISRVHDAVAEVRHLTSRSYEWIVEGDVKACFR